MILSRGKPDEALEWTERVMTRIGLTLNRAKTELVHAKTESFDFLGYAFGPHRRRKDGHWYLGASPSKKSVGRRVRGFLRRRRKAPSRGTRRFSDEVVFGEMGVPRPRSGCNWGGRPRQR